MNKYVIAFPFQGEYQFAYLNANQLANAVLPCTEDILDFKCENEGQDFNYRIYVKGKEYDVTFTTDKPHCVNIYDAFDDDGELGGYIVEKEIPWLLVKVEKNGENLYMLSDNV